MTTCPCILRPCLLLSYDFRAWSQQLGTWCTYKFDYSATPAKHLIFMIFLLSNLQFVHMRNPPNTSAGSRNHKHILWEIVVKDAGVVDFGQAVHQAYCQGHGNIFRNCKQIAIASQIANRDLRSWKWDPIRNYATTTRSIDKWTVFQSSSRCWEHSHTNIMISKRWEQRSGIVTKLASDSQISCRCDIARKLPGMSPVITDILSPWWRRVSLLSFNILPSCRWIPFIIEM